MEDPVTIESGRTFDRDNIMQYFEVQRDKAQKAMDNADSSYEEEANLEEADYIICPVNM